jgi:general stress protein 26
MTVPVAGNPGEDGEIPWQEVVALADELGPIVYLATVSPAGRPHVSPVGLRLEAARNGYTATSRDSVKGRHLAAGSEVAVHWPEGDGSRLLLLHARARLIDDPAEVRRCWDRGVLPYDPTTFWSGPDDPQLRFVELEATVAIVTSWGRPTRRWRR